ncbi:efflux RND transporter periplasmic adaptor subunit [Oleiphilus sp. HI0125]|uniref:efflux RND transporter periplasmic adaptor subunit n=1 Tax=Oleiphilus sp. HI0125 TaxID=1822266 RepID=UPI0008386327|nr:efflux RND transporter periplasmic adaptor subunit [Oleiphilus sp. HI0125]
MIRVCRTSIVISLFISLVGCSGGDEKKPTAPPPKVGVITIASEDVNPTREFTGKTEASEDVTIQARVEGYLVSQAVNDGSQVQKGDLLFELDRQNYEAALAQAKAKVAQASAANDEAQINYKRGEELIVKAVISQSQMDELTSKKLQAEASIKAANADLKNAELNLGYTKIYAPTDGMISQSEVSIGDLVTPSSTLTSLVKIKPIYVSINVSETEFVNYRSEREKSLAEGGDGLVSYAQIKLRSGDVYPEKGRFEFVDNRVNPNTGTIKIRAVFDNLDGMLISGQHVTLLVKRVQTQSQIVIPQKSIQEDQLGKYVLMLDEDSVVRKRPIQVGMRLGVGQVIESGVEVGEQLIVDGLQKVRVGSKAEASQSVVPK